MIDQRDRGRKRHKDRAVNATTNGLPEALLWEWLPDYLDPLIRTDDRLPEGPDSVGQQLLGLSTNDYARESARFDAPLAERLRLLAIYIEEEIWSLDRFIAWRAADRLYQEASKHDPMDATVLTSRALTALHMSSSGTPDQEMTISAIARSESLRATLIAPTEHAFSVAAECHYGVDIETALACAEAALELTPNSPWPSLWRAHCLHDLERYKEAADAYCSVPKDHFKGPKSWRMNLLVEQLASCLWKSGQFNEAHAEFDRILTRYEAQPHLAELTYLREAVAQWPDFQDRIASVEAHVPHG